MLDIAQLRKDPETAAARLATRGYVLDLEAFRALEAERKALQVRAEELQARRNALSKSIGQLKARGEDTSAVMAEVAGPAFREYALRIAPDDRIVVTWVPSHRKVQRQRGYNQAELLARHLASGPRPLARAPLVRKAVSTKHQKGLGRAGRQANLRGVFSLDEREAARLPSRIEAVIVVDDVYTTGATAKEVSSVLVAGMGLPVHVFTFSRAVGDASERHD